MHPECDTFKEVLKHFESDDNWDPNHPMEAIWIKLKEKRYRLEDLKGFTKTADKEEDKEVMVKDTQGGAQSSNLLMLGSSEPQIKLENEKWSKLQARLKVHYNSSRRKSSFQINFIRYTMRISIQTFSVNC